MAEPPRPLGLITAAVLLGVLAVTAAFGGDVSRIEEPVPVEGYRVVYRIEDRSGPRPSVRTEVVEVARPYGGRVEERSGAPPGGAIRSGKVSNREFGWQLDDGGELQFGLRRPPGGPTRDVSYAALADGAAAGLADAGGMGSHLGRRCTWFAFENPLPEPLARAKEASTVEICADPVGILLREVWTIHDRVVRVTEAVELTLGASSASRFLVGTDPRDAKVTQPEAEGVLRQNVVVGDDVGGRRPELEVAPPRGWKLDRDAVVVQAAQSGRPTQFSAQTFLRGHQLVVVELGLRAEYEPVWTRTEGEPLQVGDATQARIIYFGDRIELRLDTEDGFGRVVAPSRALALAFAERIRPKK